MYNNINNSKSYTIFQRLNIILMLVITCATLFPFLYIIAVSFSDGNAVLNNRVTIFPVGFNLDSYKLVLQQSSFLNGYKNTLIYSFTGTVISLLLTISCAYPLSKKNVRAAGTIMKLIVFTMFFAGGMIPTFIVVRSLGLTDKMWALILPNVISQYNLILMINFFRSLPESLEESAQIDGLNPIQILIRIVLPLSKPIIATLALFYIVGYWNDWFSALIYLNSDSKYPVMLFLRNIVMGAELGAKNGTMAYTNGKSGMVGITIRSTSIVLVSIPMLVIYPFVQKHFIKGIMLGAVKG